MQAERFFPSCCANLEQGCQCCAVCSNQSPEQRPEFAFFKCGKQAQHSTLLSCVWFIFDLEMSLCVLYALLFCCLNWEEPAENGWLERRSDLGNSYQRWKDVDWQLWKGTADADYTSPPSTVLFGLLCVLVLILFFFREWGGCFGFFFFVFVIGKEIPNPRKSIRAPIWAHSACTCCAK